MRSINVLKSGVAAKESMGRWHEISPGQLRNGTTGVLDNEFYRTEFNAEFSARVLSVSIVFGLTACLGLIANLLVIYIYGVKYKRCNFKYFLLVMGIIGLVQCTIMLPTQVAEMHYWFVFPTSWLCRVSAYVFGYTVIDCYFVLLLIALDRFRKVCRPYDWQIQPHTAKNLCVIVSVASLIFALPPGIISGNHKFVTSYNDVNITVTVCATDDIYIDRDWAVTFLLLFGGIPVSVVIIITCGLYMFILKQFCEGPAFAKKSLYTANSTPAGLSSEKLQVNVTPVPTKVVLTVNDDCETKTLKSADSPQTPQRQTRGPADKLRQAFNAFLPTGDSIRSDASSNGFRSGANRGVRHKLVRKTLVVLIITVTCIIALVITFCLHGVAEQVNNNVLDISMVTLNAFIIFHRGSFSIICAIFPIIYGIRDHKFRNAFRDIIRRSSHNPDGIAEGRNLSRDVSKC